MPSGNSSFSHSPQPLTNSIEQSLAYLVSNSHVTNQKLDAALAELKSTTSRVGQCEVDVKTAFQEIFDLKDRVNSLEQKDRSLAIRVFGLPLCDEEKDPEQPTATAKLVYERILKPILAHACKDLRLLSTTPQLQNAITEAFRLSKRSSTSNSTARPPPILIRLVSSQVKTAIFKAKKALPDPTDAEKQAGISRFHLAEDLTPPTFTLLMSLRANSAVERAWTTEGQVRYTLKEDKTGYVYKVKSVFDSVENILRK
jgi:hypothetical protein